MTIGGGPDLSKFRALREALVAELDEEALDNFESMYEAGEWQLAVEWLSDSAHDAELVLREYQASLLLDLGIHYHVERQSFYDLTRDVRR